VQLIRRSAAMLDSALSAARKIEFRKTEIREAIQS